jgi:hypothetical protein
MNSLQVLRQYLDTEISQMCGEGLAVVSSSMLYPHRECLLSDSP